MPMNQKKLRYDIDGFYGPIYKDAIHLEFNCNFTFKFSEDYINKSILVKKTAVFSSVEGFQLVKDAELFYIGHFNTV